MMALQGLVANAGCSATASSGSASASLAWAASARRVARRAQARSACQIHYHNRKPRLDPDIEHEHWRRPIGIRLDQMLARMDFIVERELPAHAGDLSPALGAPAQADLKPEAPTS